MTEIPKHIFKSYDVRGRYGSELTEHTAELIGRAYVQVLGAKTLAVGHDMREHSPRLEEALVKGITSAGADAVRIGQCSTPMSYFAAATLPVDGAIMVTASHNPGPDNGFKFCRENAIPVGEGSGLEKVRDMVLSGAVPRSKGPAGKVTTRDLLGPWCKHLRQYLPKLRSMKVVIDCGNGVSGPILHRLLKQVDPGGKLKVTWLFDEPDGTFPWHQADPLKPVNLQHLQGAVLATGATFGVAFDGDGDRLAFVDENAQFIGCDLMTALFASKLLSKRENRGKNVMYDLRSSTIVREVIEKAGGVPELSRVGHSHIKAGMRGNRQGVALDPNVTGEVIFAGELSGHFFFRDCFCVDTSERAFLLALEILSDDPRPLSKHIKPLRKYWQSGEINYRMPTDEKKQQVLPKIAEKFQGNEMFRLDGLSVRSKHWQFNVRFSNTEPVVRLTAESFTSRQDLDQLVHNVESVILALDGARQAR